MYSKMHMGPVITKSCNAVRKAVCRKYKDTLGADQLEAGIDSVKV